MILDYKNKVTGSLQMRDQFLKYNKLKGNIEENPLFSLKTSEMLTVGNTEQESFRNGKHLMMDRLRIIP